MASEIVGIEYQFTAVANGDLEAVVAHLRTVRSFLAIVDSTVPDDVDSAIDDAIKLLEE